MKTPDLKKRLIKRITETDDPAIIQEINTFIDFTHCEEPYQLSTAQEQGLAEAKSDYESGYGRKLAGQTK